MVSTTIALVSEIFDVGVKLASFPELSLIVPLRSTLIELTAKSPAVSPACTVYVPDPVFVSTNALIAHVLSTAPVSNVTVKSSVDVTFSVKVKVTLISDPAL